MPERPNQKDQQDPNIHRHDHNTHKIEHPRAIVVPPHGQQNHNDWKAHTQRVRPAQQFHYPQQFGPQINSWNNRNDGDHWQHHNRHFPNPYDGMNNFWRDSGQDNYYYDRHHHRSDRDDFMPRMLEGILGGLLSGSLVRELDKLGLDGKSSSESDEAEDLDDSDRLERASKEDYSPDRQISLNLDFSPKGQTTGTESRFERTG